MLTTIPKFLISFGLAFVCSAAAAQVVKCKGPGGSFIYSDRPCADGSDGQDVYVHGNVLDGSTDRKSVENSKIQQQLKARERDKANLDAQEMSVMQQNPPEECKFKHFSLGDKKGKALAENAKRECMQNIIAERNGGEVNDRHYRLWREHYDSEKYSRNNALNRNKTFNCMRNGIGGATCR